MTILDAATKNFTTMMKAGNLDGIVLSDLVESYKYNSDGGELELTDALRKVIRYYATPDQYEQFKKEVGI